MSDVKLTGRCYCGYYQISASAAAQTVSYCHCADCRRLSGAPVTAFAAFSASDLTVSPDWPETTVFPSGVKRWFCKNCGTQLGAQYDYLAGQIYVPIGVFDQADSLAPEMHSHVDHALCWLNLNDTLPRNAGSSRAALKTASN